MKPKKKPFYYYEDGSIFAALYGGKYVPIPDSIVEVEIIRHQSGEVEGYTEEMYQQLLKAKRLKKRDGRYNHPNNPQT